MSNSDLDILAYDTSNISVIDLEDPNRRSAFTSVNSPINISDIRDVIDLTGSDQKTSSKNSTSSLKIDTSTQESLGSKEVFESLVNKDGPGYYTIDTRMAPNQNAWVRINIIHVKTDTKIEAKLQLQSDCIKIKFLQDTKWKYESLDLRENSDGRFFGKSRNPLGKFVWSLSTLTDDHGYITIRIEKQYYKETPKPRGRPKKRKNSFDDLIGLTSPRNKKKPNRLKMNMGSATDNYL